ncbi:MAG: sulfate adenylyltransferase subunit CysN [Deltaproteobacteria bacterium]|nr:sulfate adenylyltransferase subunit CysN [Deltaproteobacteria bacterium]
MSHVADLDTQDIHAYLAQHERKELLRLLTCGSVDDGKSTLIGRLLFDAKMIYEDQLAALHRDSTHHGNAGGQFDPALLTDGLKAEREQGITIDVAYRYFSTAARKFIIADTPGHEQYTRNMATGASNCDLAIILIDARRGVLTQTRRHSFIVSLLGIQHVVVAINKMDLVDYDRAVFDRIADEYRTFAARLEVRDLQFVPISALHGDNVVEPSASMPWYRGKTLMRLLETTYIEADRNLRDLRFGVQYVIRPDLDFRGYAGTVASGVVRPGDPVLVLPSRVRSRVQSIVTYEGEQDEAFAGQAVTLTLADQVDVSRGDMLVRPGNVPHVRDRFDATIVWMAEQPLVPDRQYLLRHTTRSIPCRVRTLRHRIDINTLHREPAAELALNEIGRCELRLEAPLCFDGYRRNRTTGAFVLIDRISNATVAAGMILDQQAEDSLRDTWEAEPNSGDLQPQVSRVQADERVERFGQRPATVLLTGLSGSGKTTTAYALERRLFEQGRAVCVLDGANMRLGISKDLGFSAPERSENLRRSVEVAKILLDGGLICIASFMAPSQAVRDKARQLVGPDRFLVVHVDAPLEVCMAREQAGLYGAAQAGQDSNVPGVSSSYEAPVAPDLVLPTATWPVERCVDAIIELLLSRGVLDPGQD